MQEWWYLAGYLNVIDNGMERTFGIMVSFFNKPKHFILQLTDESSGMFYEYANTIADSAATISDDKLDLAYTTTITTNSKYTQKLYRLDDNPFNDPWVLKLDVEGRDMKNSGNSFLSALLTINAKTHPILFNGNGKMTMGWGDPSENTQYSYYYSVISYPIVPGIDNGRYIFNNQINIGDTSYNVISGQLWLDHQWGQWTGFVQPNMNYYAGYNWLAISMVNNEYMDMYNFIQKYSNIYQTQSTYLYSGDNSFNSYDGIFLPLSVWPSPTSQLIYPISVIYKDPSMNIYFEIHATVNNQEASMVNQLQGLQLWEGSCTVTPKHNGKQIVGRAYLESPQLGGLLKYI